MRPVALGRKNWIHIGSAQAGPKVAAILSVVESCRRLKLPVRDYLAAVLPGLADRRIQCLLDLTPTAWLHSIYNSNDAVVGVTTIFQHPESVSIGRSRGDYFDRDSNDLSLRVPA
jgi:hypothetical protein